MKANEISISDYVHCITDNEIVQVEEVSNCDRAEVLGHPYYRSNGGKYNILSDIDGVSLTTDILSKLGFEIRENNTAVWKKLNEDKSDFEEFILIDLEIPSLCRIEKHTRPTASFEGTIKYLHELQHAIKLVGVDLEIKL